jgi:hypothetical protein
MVDITVGAGSRVTTTKPYDVSISHHVDVLGQALNLLLPCYKITTLVGKTPVQVNPNVIATALDCAPECKQHLRSGKD